MEVKLDYVNKRNRQLNHICRVLTFIILMITASFSEELLRPFIKHYAIDLISVFTGELLYFLMLFLFLFFMVRQIDKLIPYKTGKISLREDMIILYNKGKISTFYIDKIDSLTFVKDLPHKNDKRWETQKKSSLKFTHQNKPYHLEIWMPTQEEFDAVRPIIQVWKGKLKDFKVVWG